MAALGSDDVAAAARARAAAHKMYIRCLTRATVTAERKKRKDKARALAAASPPRAPIVVDIPRYEKLETVGSGAFGTVYRAFDRLTGETVAMKCLSAEDFDEPRLDFIFASEVSALEACRGLPFVVQLRDSRPRDPDTGEALIVMEFVGRSLADAMRDGGARRHAEHEVRRLVRQILAGAAAMHRVGLMHRDIKPDNVLVDARGNLKLCDLGISRAFTDGPPFSNPVVARKYRAPELLLDATDYDARIDSWAIGCIMAELLAGDVPFRGSDAREQLSEVLDVLGIGDIREWSRCPDRLPGGCGSTGFLRDLFPSPETDLTTTAGRPMLSESGFEVLSGLLRCNPEKRMLPARALKQPWFQEA